MKKININILVNISQILLVILIQKSLDFILEKLAFIPSYSIIIINSISYIISSVLCLLIIYNSISLFIQTFKEISLFKNIMLSLLKDLPDIDEIVDTVRYSDENKLQKAITVIYEEEKTKQTFIVLLSAILVIISFFFSGIFETSSLTDTIIILTTVMILSLLKILQDYIVKFRLHSNLFGTTEHETRQLLVFIQKQLNKEDPPDDGDHNRSVFLDFETSEEEISNSVEEGFAGEGA